MSTPEIMELCRDTAKALGAKARQGCTCKDADAGPCDCCVMEALQDVAGVHPLLDRVEGIA